MSLPIPPVEPATSRALAAQNQRDRLLFAVMKVAADRGYAQATVSDVIAAAGVSRRTFYECFSNIEDCFLAAYELGAGRLDEIVSDAAGSLPADATFVQLLETVLRAYLTAFADQPEFAKSAMIEVLAAGPRARDLYLTNVQRFELILRLLADRVTSLQGIDPVSDMAITIAAGGLARFVIVELIAGRAAHLSEHVDELIAVLIEMLGVQGATSARRS